MSTASLAVVQETMSERRSSRPRKTLDYSKLEEDNDTDDEFFEDIPKPTKKKKQQEDDDWHIPPVDDHPDGDHSKVSGKTKKAHPAEKKTPKQRKAISITTGDQSDFGTNKVSKSVTTPHTEPAVVHPTTSLTPSSRTPATSEPRKLVSHSVSNHQVSTPPRLGLSSSGTPPSNRSDGGHFSVTPSSGLRLGLSRTQKLRSLHPNIRIS
ncbi:unnamed protein product [Calicophoron daubneyi]|uniref:RAD51 interacting motif domain-containing protein n=1 Tax=Calicophoron daubneyi TaxID=300641 RepID=A0AAV2TLR7_CALDB